jgi:hypothetical protein
MWFCSFVKGCNHPTVSRRARAEYTAGENVCMRYSHFERHSMLLTTSMAFMPSLKAQTAELLNIEVGAAMGRRASQEMGARRWEPGDGAYGRLRFRGFDHAKW